MDQATLDAAYNNSAAVPDHPVWLDTWRERSSPIRSAAGTQLDIPYGPKARTRIDYFPCGSADAPLFAFIHGGYWQRNAKDLFSFVANGPIAHGIDVATIGYTLAPDARLTDIVAEVRQAVAFLHASAGRFGNGRIFAGGWSAGGHLAAMVADEPGVKGTLPISGIFDLEPIALSYINAPLHLSRSEIGALSPQRVLKPSQTPQCLAVGGNELAELIRQSRDFCEAAQKLGAPASLDVLPGHHHFSILDEIWKPDGALTRKLAGLTRQA
jgi:arylformamidase